MQNKFRHVYCNLPSSATPFHFRFQVSSPVLRDPSVFGRPVGLFNSDCYGITPQDVNDTRMKVKLSEEPNTAKRFPLATAFLSRQEAALECDFWKLVLRRKFYLEIPWSHGTFEAYLEAAQFAQQNPLERLADEKQWSHELLDFINEHSALLYQHRDLSKPELDLDEWERVAKEKGNRKLLVWVHEVRAVQAKIEELPTTDRLMSLAKHLNHLRGCRVPDCGVRSEYAADFNAIMQSIAGVLVQANKCETLAFSINNRKHQLELMLMDLINNRPSVECESGESTNYQSEA